MKNTALIFFFFAFSTSLFAQNPRIERFGDRRTETYTYRNGGDSVRYSIVEKNDTLQKTVFFRNGKTTRITWKKDSCYNFDVFGRLIDKRYGWNETEDTYSYKNSCDYDIEGRLRERRTSINGIYENTIYDEVGHVLSKRTIFNAPKSKYIRSENKDGMPVNNHREDTLLISGKWIILNFDTTFYKNGQPRRIRIYEDNYPQHGTQYFNESGKLIKYKQPDSFNLILFKDNVDCYYGLKNKRGDTIVKPRFDRIDLMNDHFFVAYIGESSYLLDLKGAPLNPPIEKITNVEIINSYTTYQGRDSKADNKDSDLQDVDSELPETYFKFTVGDKYGVMDSKLNILMPPQYLEPTNQLGNADLFYFDVKKQDTIVRRGVISPSGKPIFGEAYTFVQYADYKDYFIWANSYQSSSGDLSSTFRNSGERGHILMADKIGQQNAGIGRSDGTVVLKPQYFSIEHIYNTPLYKTSVIKAHKDGDKGIYYEGIFNVETNRWLLDTTYFQISNEIKVDAKLFVIKNIQNQKYGIMDTSGRYILPLVYDSIGLFNPNLSLFCVKKDGKYQIFDARDGKIHLHRTKYNFLKPTTLTYERDNSEFYVYYFFAQKKGKFGVIDADENIIKPFEFDYVSQRGSVKKGFYLVKNNQVHRYDLESLPNFYPSISRRNDKVQSFSLVENRNRVFFANDTGKVIIPPQYELANEGINWQGAVVFDAQRHKKIIFYETGAIVDFPFTHLIVSVHPKSRVILVQDSSRTGLGVVSTNGKLLVSCKNYGLSMGDDNTSVFFVKRDTPLVNVYVEENRNEIRICLDTLSMEDTDWQMYDGDGKLLSTAPFRFPINFINGVGVGLQGEYFNLYRTDGSIIKPFAKKRRNEDQNKIENTEGSKLQDFASIRQNSQTNFYALYYRQGLASTLILTKPDGEILIEGGRYNGMSRFFGKYALVSAGQQIGLIDSFGHEVIPPQNLRTYTGQFVDSLYIWIEETKKAKPLESFLLENRKNQLPLSFYGSNSEYHPDSLNINPKQRAALWNLLLEQCTNNLIKTISDLAIPRAYIHTSVPFFDAISSCDEAVQKYPHRIAVADSTISFVLSNGKYDSDENRDFHNFYHRNNRWENLQINDLLQIQGEKRWQMNDLIIKKVKALKDQEIDCSNVSAFITTVENRWMLTKEGIDFCFESTGGRGDFVIISFTWAELAPFLKMKIF